MRLPLVRPHALLFDLDGVLINSMRYHTQAWQLAVRTCVGGRVSRAEIYRREGEPGFVTAHDLLRAQGCPQTIHAVRMLLRAKEERFMALRDRVRLYPAAHRLLTVVEKSGLPLGLVTGTSRSEVVRIVPAKVRQQFAVVVTGDQVRCGKPHPAPYVVACKRLHQRPHNVLVVENAPFGIASARAARIGWIIAVATSLSADQLHGADVIVPSLASLCVYLRRLLHHPAN